MATLEKIQELRKKAEDFVESLVEASGKVNGIQVLLNQTIEQYIGERVNFLLVELESRRLSWCTQCSAVLPKKDLLLMFMKGRKEDRSDFRNFENLHRVCVGCYKRAEIRSGTYGKWNSSQKDQESFFAYPVEKRVDGYYFRPYQTAEWEKLDEKCCAFLIKPPRDLFKKLAVEFKIPPKIRLGPENKIIDIDDGF